MKNTSIVILTDKEGSKEIVPLNRFKKDLTVQQMLEEAEGMGIAKIEFKILGRGDK